MVDKIIWEDNCVTAKFSKTLSFSDNLESMSTVYSDKRSDNLKYIVLDMTDVNKIVLEDSEVRTLSGYDYIASKRLFEIKFAILLDGESLNDDVNKFIRFFQKYDTSWKVNSFYNIADLKKWIE